MYSFGPHSYLSVDHVVSVVESGVLFIIGVTSTGSTSLVLAVGSMSYGPDPPVS